MKKIIYNAITSAAVLASISSSVWFSLFTSNVYEIYGLNAQNTNHLLRHNVACCGNDVAVH